MSTTAKAFNGRISLYGIKEEVADKLKQLASLNDFKDRNAYIKEVLEAHCKQFEIKLIQTNLQTDVKKDRTINRAGEVPRSSSDGKSEAEAGQHETRKVQREEEEQSR